MKNKIIIPIIVMLVLIIAIVGFIFFNNRIITTIMLDINPSIEIGLTRNKKVKKVVALNDDAKEIVSSNLIGKSLDDTLKVIANNVLEKGYTEFGEITILVYSKGTDMNKEIKKTLEDSFKKTHTEIIIVESVTKKDEELAKRYNITPSKAAYINSISKDNEDVSIETLIDKPVSELKETKETGLYCDSDYTLEGGSCLKEIDRVVASEGKVCPIGYYPYNNRCYEEVDKEEGTNLECRDEFTLEGENCVSTQTVDSKTEPAMHEMVCPTGTSLADNGMCVNYNKIASKVDGFVCNQANSRLHGNTCIIYEIIEAKHN